MKRQAWQRSVIGIESVHTAEIIGARWRMKSKESVETYKDKIGYKKEKMV